MATRVLNTIRERDRIAGFRIVSSLKGHGSNIFIKSKTDAIVYYKTVEKFENVRLNEHGQWEGIECSLDKLPYTDKAGHWIKCNEHLFILGRMYDGDDLVGYKLMDLNGNVFYLNTQDTLIRGKQEGLINAKIIGDNFQNSYISAIRGNIPKFQVSDRSANLRKQNKVSNMSVNVNEQKKRYKELAILFGKKQAGTVTDRDIAAVVGARNSAEYSQKIHEYLFEDMSKTDNEILQKLYNVYKSIIASQQQSVPVQTQAKPVQTVQQKPVTQSANTADVSNPEIKHMRDLIAIINKASEVYYSGEDEIMSNYEWDQKYDELQKLEQKTGFIFSDSPTQKVGYEIKTKLTKVKHPSRMLSLDKTKDRENLALSLGGQEGFLGWKLDGLTIVLRYENGELVSAVTRGDGVTGEDVTHNARVAKGVPLKIAYKDTLVVRGEALISYEDFEKINAKITNVEDKYKNPRNLASGSIRQLDSKIAKERHIRVIAFTVVEGFDWLKTYSAKLNELKKYGFDVVEFVKVTKDTTVQAIGEFEKRVKSLPYPTDGLVITIDDIAYGESLGTTAKFPRNSKAFKWADEAVETTLIDIEWSVGRTGAITPVAIFKPVDIEGSTVQRASMHNLSVMKSLLGDRPYKGQKIWVIKANLIIPMIVKAEKD